MYHNRYGFSVETKYEKEGGSQIYRRLGVTVAGANYYGSWGYQSSGTTSSKSWDIYNAGCKSGVGWVEVRDQGRFQTPPTPSC
ncbi:hypothetical protein [Streptomyces glaucosporus]|uniref:hypothetical protein n=1 Tax=Streptomyces glaucosporus TaxID=284044 RepID=UPI0031DC0276